MKVAGRKRSGSIAIPCRPGRISSMAFSTPSVTSSVLARGSFWTISMIPCRWLIAASPQSGWWSSTICPRSCRRIVWPFTFSIGTFASWASVTIG
jgi:hypothetical protein